MNKPPEKVVQTMLLYFRKTSALRIAKKREEENSGTNKKGA